VSSSSPTAVHKTCKKAYNTKKELPIDQLKVDVKGLSAAELNAKDTDMCWAALDYLVLCDTSLQTLGEAVGILLEAGADPFTDPVFESSAIAKCVKYKNPVVLNRFLDALDAAGWDRFMKKLSSRIVCDKNSAIGEGVWVFVDGTRKGKTNIHIEGNPIGTDRHGVHKLVSYEDGSSEGAVAPERITILPQLHSSMKELIFDKVNDSHAQMDRDSILKMLKTCEETDRAIKDMWKGGGVLISAI